MTARIEHANLCVRNVDSMIQFLQTAFPEFEVRHDQTESDGSRWVHVGTDETYLALNQASPEEHAPWEPYAGKPGLNHLAFEVEDVESIRAKLTAAGYRDSTVENIHPHRKRIYFYDPEGNDWEFVQYLSTDPARKNDYSLPDR